MNHIAKWYMRDTGRRIVWQLGLNPPLLGYNIISTFHGNYVKFNIDFARKKNIYLTQIICNILGVGEGHNIIPVFKMALREDTHKKSVFLVVSDH